MGSTPTPGITRADGDNGLTRRLCTAEIWVRFPVGPYGVGMKLTKEQAEKLLAEALRLASNEEPGKAIILNEEDIRKILDPDSSTAGD